MTGGKMVLWTLLSLGGIGACAQLLPRPGVNRPGVVALMLVFAGWMLVVLGNLAKRAQGPSGHASLLLFVAAVLAMVGAILLGCVALVRHDRAAHTQGRGQAVAGILLGLLFLISSGKPILLGVLGAFSDPRLTHGETTRIVEPELGFALTCPSPWFSLKPEIVFADACTALGREEPDQSLTVSVAPVSGLLTQTELVESHMERIAILGPVSARKDSTIQVGPLAFTRVTSRGRSPIPGQGERAYEHWILLREGFAWRIVAWGAAGEAGRLAREVRAIVETFEILGSPSSSAAEAR
jgi:hypothetical protein